MTLLLLSLIAQGHTGSQTIAHQHLSFSVHDDFIELRFQSVVNGHDPDLLKEPPSLDQLESALLVEINGERVPFTRISEALNLSEGSVHSSLLLRSPITASSQSVQLSTGNFPDISSLFSWSGEVNEHWTVEQYSFWDGERALPHLSLIGERYRTVNLVLSPVPRSAFDLLRSASSEMTSLEYPPSPKVPLRWPKLVAMALALLTLQAARQAKRQ